MKKLVLSSITLVTLLSVFAAPIRYKLLSSTSNWYNTANWAPAGLPAAGDTAFIPAGIQLTLSSDLNLQNTYFDLYGSLVLSGSNMKLTFQNNSTINVHTSGTIAGTSASQQIILDNTIIYKGDQPLLTGAKIATISTMAFTPYTEFTVLPVKFISFSVAHTTVGYQIQWTAAEEMNAAYYQVQRSTDGTTWTIIATMQAIGNSTNTYTYTDRTSAGNTAYYRIRQSDTDGTSTYTTVRTLKNGNTAPVITTAQHKVAVVFAQPLQGKVTIEVIGMNGYTAIKQVVNAPAGTLQLATSGLQGIYIVRVSNGRDLNITKEILL